MNPAVKPEEQSARPEPSSGGGVAVTSAKDPVIPDFVMIRPIGRGSYGDVWLARGLTGVYRAIKVVWRDRFADAEPFEREFRGLKKFTTMSLPESGQLALLHVGQNEADGFFYYVMELADDVDMGREVDPERYHPLTLKEVRDRRGRVPADECVAIGIELARALAGLHSRGLVHRDIKPSNVIMVGGAPKLADIGLVASAADARTFVGTEGYTPPEGPGKPSADVFALGKMLYELATGLDRTEYPRLPGELRKMRDRKVVLELNELILQSCDPEEGRRYRDGSALLKDLLAIQGGHSIRLKRSRVRIMRLASVSVLVLAAAGSVFWWNTRTSSAEPTPSSEERQLVAKAWEQMSNTEADPEGLALADGFCRRASELDPMDADVWAAWSQVDSWFVTWGIDDSAERREAARSNALRALKLAPHSYEARLAEACYLMRAGPWTNFVPTSGSEADRLLRQLLKEKPDEPRAERAFVVLQTLLGHQDEARGALTRLTRNPQFAAWAWTNIAALEMTSSPADTAVAEAAIRRSLAIRPLKGAVEWIVTIDLRWKGDLDAAGADLESIPASILQTDYLVWDVYSVYYWRREPDKLLNYLQGIPRDWIHAPVFNAPTSMLIGNAQWLAGRKDAARAEWRKALELVEQRLAEHPTDALQEDQKGMLLGYLGEYAEAEKSMQLAADMTGQEAFDWGDLMQLKMAEGQLDAAMEILAKHIAPTSTAASMRVSPGYDRLRGSPRFKAILAQAEADPTRSPNAPK